MKLYHFNPNTYSVTWHVMAASREAAIAAIQVWINKQHDEWLREFYQERLDRFVREDKNHGDKGWVIEEFDVGEVSQGEIS